MKRFILALAVVSAVAAGAASAAVAPTVTLDQDARTIIYGGSVTLSGSITPPAANQPVTITQMATGGRTSTVTATTGNDGSYSVDVTPRRETSYQAKYQTATSNTRVVFVRPRIGLRRNGAGRYAVAVVAARSFVGKYVWVTRWDAKRKLWANVKRVYLTRFVKTTGASTAGFQLRIARRTKIRVYLNASQTRPDYVAGYSNFILS
jgi:hypothetical protein